MKLLPVIIVLSKLFSLNNYKEVDEIHIEINCLKIKHIARRLSFGEIGNNFYHRAYKIIKRNFN
jgi:hypothetical protein